MSEFFSKLFSSDFMPHGHCYFWRPEIVWLHVVSDASIAIAYYCIPVALWYLVKQRKDLAFNWMFACFGAFIFACGTTHAFQIWTLWHGTYRLEGLIKALTGGLSVVTALLLLPLVPRAIRLPTHKQLADANRALEAHIAERQKAEAEVRRLNAELEDRVARRTAALKRSNEELAQFAYVASHDLQEPLRMVSSYTQLLKMRYEDKLDAAADEYIGFAVDGANRMQSLIEDLLAFSRVDPALPELTLISANGALDDALATLRLAITESRAKVERAPLPEVWADQRQLAQVFQNLIANSIKYRGDRTPEIRIAVREAEAEWIFSVADNGIGFDPVYAERVFGLFKRLHGVEFPGTGIGLSIARKIMTRHGGRIWCESKEGAGSTFYFSLPNAARLTSEQSAITSQE